jgi:hypothetical protein
LTGSPAFEVTTVPVSRFAAFEAVPADKEASLVLELLGELGGAPAAPRPAAEDPTASALFVALADWASADPEINSMLYWAGHGEADRDGAWLAAYDTRAPMAGTGISPEQVAAHVVNQWKRRRSSGTWTLIAVEACGAKRFVDLLNAKLSSTYDRPERLVLIGVGGHGRTHLGAFRTALRDALLSFTDNDTAIRLDDLVGRIRGRLTAGTVQLIDLAPVPEFPRRQVLPGGITATVDVYAELQLLLRSLSADERGHFLPKAQGAEQGELAWYFTGRAAERREISTWLRESRAGMLIVTGRAGSGKSALLGNVLAHSHPQLRDLLVETGLVDALPAVEQPPDNAFDAVIHLTGVTTGELVHRIGRAIGVTSIPGTPLGQDLDDLIAALHHRHRELTLLVDALDEAQEPATIAASVLRRIAAVPGCRVVVGTRSSTKEGPDQPDTSDEDLLDALGRDRTTVTITVTRDPDAIREYVYRRLTAARAHHQLPETTPVDDIVGLIEAQPSRQFLYARLAVHEIIANPELVQPARREDLLDLLGRDHRALFAAAVDRLARLNPVNEPLLEALALARGRGLPRADRIWALVAGALVDEAGIDVAEADIDAILDTAAPYIMLDAEHGQSVYRLAHRTFQEHFLADGPDEK